MPPRQSQKHRRRQTINSRLTGVERDAAASCFRFRVRKKNTVPTLDRKGGVPENHTREVIQPFGQKEGMQGSGAKSGLGTMVLQVLKYCCPSRTSLNFVPSLPCIPCACCPALRGAVFSAKFPQPNPFGAAWMDCWSVGFLDCWINEAQQSIYPTIHLSNNPSIQ